MATKLSQPRILIDYLPIKDIVIINTLKKNNTSTTEYIEVDIKNEGVKKDEKGN